LDQAFPSTVSALDDEDVYQVKLEAFTGPMDLLLHLIRKHKINIYDIPVALIAQQYLEYLSLMKTLNLSLAGEFLVMAATLLHIKSRMLLPKEEKSDSADEDDEGVDPRKELVRQLVEYERFKDAAVNLIGRQQVWQESFARELVLRQEEKPTGMEDQVEDDEDWSGEDLHLFDLLSALQEVLDRTAAQNFVELTRENWTVQDRIQCILDRLEVESSLPFDRLFDQHLSRPLIITTFLALLELVRMNLVRLFQGEWFGPIHVTRRFVPAGASANRESMGDVES
jgi:segregation and condensation protein A